MLEVQIASRSLMGARDRNEDDFRVGRREGTAFAVLSDGAGGHKNGALASDLVVRVVARILQSEREPQSQTLHNAVHDAHDLLLAQQEGAVDRDRMHATLVALWIDAELELALWSHVGDSRLYLLRGGQIRHVTRDDSVVQQMTDAGFLTPEAARHHPNKNRLLCAMGAAGTFVAHSLERPYSVRGGDAFLLCTDGWWDGVTGEEIERTLGEASSPEDWLARMEALIQAAARSDQDNHSAIALWLADAR